MDPSEKAAIEAVQGGDVDRFGELVDQHKDQVYGVLRRLVRDEDLAEDLAQTAFVQAYEALDGFRGEASFGTWVTQIGIHLARASFRRGSRENVVSLEELVEHHQESSILLESDAASDPFETTVQSELEERLEQSIAELSETYREAFVMRHLEGMSYERIASITGDSVGALKVRTHRARKMLLERLHEQENGTATERGLP